MMRTALTWCLAVALLSTALRAEGPKHKLKQALPPGKLVLTIVEQAEGSTNIGGTALPVRDASTSVWRVDVAGPDKKDEKKVVLRLSETRTEGESNGEAYRYDSSGKGEQKGERAFVYGPLMATDVLLTLDADDSVVEASGLNKLWASLEAKARSPAQKSILTEVKISLNDKFFEGNFRRIESIMPRNAVAVGSAWKSGLRLDLPVVGEIKVRYDCKLTSIEKGKAGDMAVIEATAGYSLSSPKTVQAEGATLKLNKIDMEEKATILFDLKAGHVVADQSTRKLEMAAKASEGNEEKDVVTRTTTTIKTTFAPEGGPAAAPSPVAAPVATPSAGPQPQKMKKSAIPGLD